MAAPKVFGAESPAFTPFKEPEAGDYDNFSMSEHVGEGVIVTVGGIETIPTKAYGDKPAARLDVVAFTRGGPATFLDTLVFSAAAVDQVKAFGGGDVFVAEVASYKSKFGRDGYKFAEPSEATIKAATAYLAAASPAQPPF